MSRARRLAGAAFGTLVVLSCSLDPEPTPASGTDAGGQAGTGGGASEAGDVQVPNGCVQPGDKGNSLGIGEYCSPGGNQCAPFPTAPLCLADAVPAEGQFFCTRLCNAIDASDVCGEGAFCLAEGRGSACVPNRCLDDAGAGDASGDAAGEAMSDAAPD